jgi:site-specific recombinase XerC
LIGRNPARGRRRRLKQRAPERTCLDRSEQIVALLEAAGELDAEARVDRRATPRRTCLAAPTLAGLRIGEAVALRWRDVDLAAGRLRVTESKTDAGVRQVDLLPALREELSIHKATAQYAGPDDFVFPTARGQQQDIGNLRQRFLGRSLERANANLAERGSSPLPDGITPHSLRRTFISLLLATGREVPYVMRQVGHADPKVTLSIYAQVMYQGDGERERLKIVSEASDWAPLGTGGDHGSLEPGEQLSLDALGNPAGAGDSESGRYWARTSDPFLVRDPQRSAAYCWALRFASKLTTSAVSGSASICASLPLAASMRLPNRVVNFARCSAARLADFNSWT